MRQYTINEAAKVTGIPRARVQRAVILNSVEATIQSGKGLKTRYLIAESEVNKLVEIFNAEEPTRCTMTPKKRREVQEDGISVEIRRKLEVLREERELEQSLQNYY